MQTMQRAQQQVLTGTGEVLSYTVVTAPPQAYAEQAPYILALIQLDEGPVVTAQLTDVDVSAGVEIGQRVEMVTRKLRAEGAAGMIVYGYKFRPIVPQAS
jgi:uncharacterized protein